MVLFGLVVLNVTLIGNALPAARLPNTPVFQLSCPARILVGVTVAETNVRWVLSKTSETTMLCNGTLPRLFRSRWNVTVLPTVIGIAVSVVLLARRLTCILPSEIHVGLVHCGSTGKSIRLSK